MGMGYKADLAEVELMQKNRTILYLVALAVLTVCFSTGVYVYRTFAQINKNLTNEYHETFRHTSKLQLDTLGYVLTIEQFINHQDQESIDRLKESLDLMFLRYDVIKNQTDRLSQEEEKYLDQIFASLIKTDALLQSNINENLAAIKAEAKILVDVESELAHQHDKLVQNSIAASSASLNMQAIKIALFLTILALSAIITIYLFYRQQNISAEMETLRNLLSNILDSMPSLLIGVDHDGNITQWNTACTVATGKAFEEVRGNKLVDELPEMTALMELVKNSIVTREVQRQMHRPKNAKDGLKFEDITIFPLLSENMGGAVIRIDDVTQKHELEEQLKHRSKMDAIGKLAGGVAHDFNNMLAGILGASQLLSSKQRNLDDKSSELVDIIVRAASRAADLTAKLLMFSRKGSTATNEISMHSLIDETVAMLKRTVDKKIRISVMKSAQNETIQGDSSQLQNALLNLAINAAHAMPSGGEIFIDTRNTELDRNYCKLIPFDISPGDYFEINIADSGKGIPRDLLPRIFEPFFTTKDQGKGTGLGLAAVYGAIQNHNGAIFVESEINKGTTFTLYLPTITATKEVLSKSTAVIPGTGAILLVDDEKINLTTGKLMLQEMGYSVITAENGITALQIYEEKQDEIDLIILDMIMPLMNGRELFQKLQQINPQCKGIVSSGYLNDENIEDLLGLGIKGFIAKPYKNHELSRLISEVITTSTESIS